MEGRATGAGGIPVQGAEMTTRDMAVIEHPEWETTPYHSAVAAGYGVYESLADVFRQIGCDEGVHKEISLARTKRPKQAP